jgi:hypothetical protein
MPADTSPNADTSPEGQSHVTCRVFVTHFESSFLKYNVRTMT